MNNECHILNVKQLINHGVSKELMNDTMSVFNEVFEMPAQDLLCLLTAILYHLSNPNLPKTITEADISVSLTFPNVYVSIISQTGCWELLN